MPNLYIPGIINKVVNRKKALGIDVSKWQGEMNWETAFNAGADFAFIRAGSCTSEGGNCYEDYQFQRNSEIASQYMPVSYYWYMRPNHSPFIQAEYFYNLIKDKDCDFGLVDDAEVSGGLTPVYVNKQHKIFCEQLQTFTNKEPILYTSKGFWKYKVPNSPGYPAWAAALDLWIANYNVISPALPSTWSNWKFWQFSADRPPNYRGKEFGAEGSKSIDLNYFNGTKAELNAYADSGVIPPVIPPVSEDGFTMTALFDGQNVRSGPSTDYAVVGQLKKGDVLTVEDVAGYSAWVKFDGNKWAAAQYRNTKFLRPS